MLVLEGVMHRPRHRAILVGDYKLLWQPEGGPEGESVALFDLARDPAEAENLVSTDATLEEYRPFITRALAAADAAVPAAASSSRPMVPLHPDVERRLKSLGYIK
jgi:hypothetical protein